MSFAQLPRILLSLGVALLTGEAAVRVAANFLPEVRYLSTMRVKSRLRHHATLEAFLKAQSTHLVPYRNWRNYFNNALGFNDAEFEIPKPPGATGSWLWGTPSATPWPPIRTRSRHWSRGNSACGAARTWIF